MRTATEASSRTVAVAISTAVAASVVSLLLLRLLLRQENRRTQWHITKEEERQEQHRLLQENVANNDTIVGPNPVLVAVLASSTHRTDTSTAPGDTKSKQVVQMLTTYHVGANKSTSKSAPINCDITVVIVHGFGCTSLEFQALAKLLQIQHPNLNIFRYDRILLTDRDDNSHQWSTQMESQKRDAATLTQELYSLLQSRCSNHKYLLIGHSYGGLVAQVFANTYPTTVAGMVLIDPAHEQQFHRLPFDFTFGFTAVVPKVLKVYQYMAGTTGLIQWLDRWNLFNFPPLFLLEKNSPIRLAAIQLYDDADVWRAVAGELLGCHATFDAMNAISDTKSATTTTKATPVTKGQMFRQELYAREIPIGLVIAGHRQFSPTMFPKAVTTAFLEMHQDMPARIFMADKSDHWVHLQQPEVIVEAVAYVLKEITTTGNIPR